MLLWSASSWDMHTLEVSVWFSVSTPKLSMVCLCSGGRAYSNAHFRAGSGPIFLDDVQCTSSSSKLLECPSRPILSHNCLHSDDAGVGCEGGNDTEWIKEEIYYSPLCCIQLHVQRASCDWQEATLPVKGE